MPSDSSRRRLEIDDPRPHGRGVARGRELRDELPAALDVYLRLFRAGGVDEPEVRSRALRLVDAIDAWRPRYVEEIEGVAAGAGLETWQAAALNGRTEILAGTRLPGECSTIAFHPAVAGAAPFGAQTWDWHEELDPYWHVQQVRGTPYAYAGLAEYGVPAKIGMNSAGLGLFLNILGHRDDAATGVPVHIVAAAVLAEAGTVEEAVELVATTPVSASTALTLIDDDAIVCAELSPVGVATLRPRDGLLVHTNHFLDPLGADGEKPGVYDPDSQQRHALVSVRLARDGAPADARRLLDHLRSGPGEPPLCCVPEPGAVFGERWRTLATVVLEPAHRRVRILAGSPLDADRRPWIELRAADSAAVR
jgi:Acyl-coenzyme A:6-aminopenicillanic acid acyl-transferase